MKICVYLFIELAVQYNLTYKNNTLFEFGIQTNNFFSSTIVFLFLCINKMPKKMRLRETNLIRKSFPKCRANIMSYPLSIQKKNP